MQEVHISKSVKLLDSPGVVALTSNPAASMALRSLQVEEGQENILEAVRALLKQCDKIQVRKAPIMAVARLADCFAAFGNVFRALAPYVSDHAPVQCRRLPELPGVFKPACQKARIYAERRSSQHGTGS